MEKQKMRISLYSMAQGAVCIAPEDGELVFQQIKKGLDLGWNIDISFLNTTLVTASFLNVAFGKLYGIFSHEEISDRLAVSDIKHEDKVLLKHIIDISKEFFKKRDESLELSTMALPF